MELDADACYRIIQARDPRWDGKFFTAVRTTGVYCRPVCPSRLPARRNVTFFPLAAAAEAAGFRPCKRCRPETAPGAPAWSGTLTTVRSALRLIGDGFLDEHSVPDLAARLGMGERHLRRLFDEHLGAAPAAVAQSRRVHFAARVLRETALPLTQVALSAGFGSVRQFNDVFRSVFGDSPSVLRRAAAGPHGLSRRGRLTHTLTLSYRPPYQWKALLDFFRVRAVAGVEEVDDDSYRRSIALGGAIGTMHVSRAARGKDNALAVSFSGIEPAMLGEAVRRARRMFDLDSDPTAISEHLARDRKLAALVRARPGLRLPVTWEPFEAVVRAVLGQQVSVAGAITIAGRLAARCGRPLDGDPTLTRVFPGPADVAVADLSNLGAPTARARTIVTVARAVLSGAVPFDGYTPAEELQQALVALPGIGPWSAQYVALRGFGEPDAFPAADLGIRKAMDARGYPADAR
ncbi:MAG TPA: AlkA N-terminal domain-containing protein, partial [Spirochaetia bacterium]|nr:AlkA N-terminal domain-containing protein [Spirochaetia bacterium]